MDERASPLRLLPTNPGLAFYVRARRDDHTTILTALTEGRLPTGVVVDPALDDRQRDLIAESHRLRVETVLDPMAMELATPGGRLRRAAMGLPWSGVAAQAPATLSGDDGTFLVEALADWAAGRRLRAVLAPSHYIEGPKDPIFAIDRHLAARLREALDRRGMSSCAIYYPLAMPLASLRDPGQAMIVANRLGSLDIDGIWLRFHPFGSTASGPVSIRRYLAACAALETLNLPLVGERTGAIGLALMAFGSVSGIECGIGLGERFDMTSLLKPRIQQDAFGPHAMVYVELLRLLMRRDVATKFYANGLMRSRFGCKDSSCCPKGPTSTLRDPRRHDFIRRLVEVSSLAEVPQGLRADHYLENYLRPATDAALLASRAEPSLEAARRRLDETRVTLGAIRRQGRPTNFVPPPAGRRSSSIALRKPGLA